MSKPAFYFAVGIACILFVVVDFMEAPCDLLCFLATSGLLNIFAAISFRKIEKACERLERMNKILIITSEDHD